MIKRHQKDRKDSFSTHGEPPCANIQNCHSSIAGTGSYNSLYLPLQSTLPHHPGEKTGIDLLPTQHSPEHLCRGGSTIRVHVFPTCYFFLPRWGTGCQTPSICSARTVFLLSSRTALVGMSKTSWVSGERGS